jgi:orotidine-5'-phosphate decarboxylase
MSFTQRLRQVQIIQNSLLCIGLDADENKIPAHIQSMENPVLEFNRRIIEATHDLVCAYKPNLAFYEAMGEGGITVFKRH